MIRFTTGNPAVEILTGSIDDYNDGERERDRKRNNNNTNSSNITHTNTNSTNSSSLTPIYASQRATTNTHLVYVYDIPNHISLSEFHEFIHDHEESIHTLYNDYKELKESDKNGSLGITHVQIVVPDDFDENVLKSNPKPTTIPKHHSSSRDAATSLTQFPTEVTSSDSSTTSATSRQKKSSDEPSNHLSHSMYMILLHFKSLLFAQLFVNYFHQRPYNFIEKDVCNCALVKSITFDQPRHSFPFVLLDGRKRADKHLGDSRELDKEPTEKRSTKTPQLGPLTPMQNALTIDDLPICPVCLDVIHPPSSPMLTILCLHHFHFDCLSKWTDSTCPVCRYKLSPSLYSACQLCGHSDLDHLWMCIVCGHVACGRYVSAHAVQHWKESGHQYAVAVNGQRVWDYVSDTYVHRLISNNSDGKPVEFRRRHRGNQSRDDETVALKLEDLLIEYNFLLSSQLDKQRAVYNQQLSQMERLHTQSLAEINTIIHQAEENCQKLEMQLDKLKSEAESETQKIQQANTDYTTLQKQYQQLNSLHQKLKVLAVAKRQATDLQQAEVEKLERQALDQKGKEIADKEEELNDLKFFVKTQRQVSKSALKDDIQQGKLFVPIESDSSTETSSSSSSGKNKNRRKR